jgi:hypothetical protein
MTVLRSLSGDKRTLGGLREIDANDQLRHQVLARLGPVEIRQRGGSPRLNSED